MTRLGRSTLLLNSKAPKQMTAECWRWRPRWNQLASSTSCFGSIETISVSRTVSEIFSVKEWHDLETRGRGRSRSLKMAPFDRSYKLSVGRPL